MRHCIVYVVEWCWRILVSSAPATSHSLTVRGVCRLVPRFCVCKLCGVCVCVWSVQGGRGRDARWARSATGPGRQGGAGSGEHYTSGVRSKRSFTRSRVVSRVSRGTTIVSTHCGLGVSRSHVGGVFSRGRARVCCEPALRDRETISPNIFLGWDML